MCRGYWPTRRRQTFLEVYVSCRANFAEQALSHSLPVLHKRGPGAAPNWRAEDLLKASVKGKTRIYKLRNSSNQIIKVTKSGSSNSLQVIFSWRTYGHISRGEVLHRMIRKCFKMRVLCEQQKSPNGRQLHWLRVLLCKPSINPHSVIMCGQAC